MLDQASLPWFATLNRACSTASTTRVPRADPPFTH
jgi:hypothetical protein